MARGRRSLTPRRDVMRSAFKPGSRFRREYHRVTHVMEINEEGALFGINKNRAKTTTRTNSKMSKNIHKIFVPS